MTVVPDVLIVAVFRFLVIYMRIMNLRFMTVTRTTVHTIYQQYDFVEFPSAACNVAADTRYVLSFISSQHAVDAVYLYCSIAFHSESHLLFFLKLVFVPVLRVFMSVGSVATELAQTGTKLRHVEAAAGSFSPKPEVMSYKEASYLISTTQNATAVHTVDEVPAAEQVECADVTLSQGNSPEHGFISVTKKSGDIRALIIVKIIKYGEYLKPLNGVKIFFNPSYSLQKGQNYSFVCFTFLPRSDHM